jgi:copper resistance protein B
MAEWRRRFSLAICVVSLTAVLQLCITGTASAQHSAKDMMDWGKASFLLFDELEYVPAAAGRPIEFEALGWYGGAINRLWVRSEAEVSTRYSEKEAELEVMYGRLVTPYWDALVGVRVDRQWGDESATRALLAVGIVGLAPLRFEFAPTLYVSKDGDLAARLDASYQFLLTQRLVLEPGLDMNLASRAVPEFGIGSGLNDVKLAARLRYEIRRKFGPYVGVTWTKRVGSTADLARAAGEDASGADLVLGVRMWR